MKQLVTAIKGLLNVIGDDRLVDPVTGIRTGPILDEVAYAVEVLEHFEAQQNQGSLSVNVAELESKVTGLETENQELRELAGMSSREIQTLRSELEELTDNYEIACGRLDRYHNAPIYAMLQTKQGVSTRSVRFGEGRSHREIIDYCQTQLGWGKSSEEEIHIVRLEDRYGLSQQLVRI